MQEGSVTLPNPPEEIQQKVDSAVPAQSQLQPKTQPEYAGFWVRYAAGFVDGVVIGIPLAIFILVVGLASQSLGLTSGEKSLWENLIYLLFIPINLFFVTKYGATPGKMLFGLKIVSKHGVNPDLKTAFLREIIGKIVSSLILNIGFLMVAFSKEKQGLHDKIAGTHVVLTRPIAGFRKASVFIIALFLFIAIPLMVIIAVLVLITLNPAKRVSEAKDAARKNDIGAIATELQAYYSGNGRYPSSLGDLVTSGGLKSTPKDPLGGEYSYTVSSDGSSVALYAKLEKGNAGKDAVWCWESSEILAREVPSASYCTGTVGSNPVQSDSDSNSQDLAGPFAIVVDTVGCKDLSCLVALRDNLPVANVSFTSADKIAPSTQYDVYICSPNCGTGTALTGWNPRTCTSDFAAVLKVNSKAVMPQCS